MNVLPWRVRKVISDRFPLFYHLVANMGASANSAEYWDARLAETWDGRDWPTKTQRLIALMRRDEAILDVGCGTGKLLRTLATEGYTALNGMEISRYACERLRGDGITMYEGTLPDIPIEDARFDVVIASQVLEHVIRRKRFVAEIARVLKPGGRAYIFVPDDCLGPIDESEHVIKYTQESLRRFLAKTFDIESLESMHDVNFEMPILFAQLRKRAA